MKGVRWCQDSVWRETSLQGEHQEWEWVCMAEGGHHLRSLGATCPKPIPREGLVWDAGGPASPCLYNPLHGGAGLTLPSAGASFSAAKRRVWNPEVPHERYCRVQVWRCNPTYGSKSKDINLLFTALKSSWARDLSLAIKPDRHQ